MTLNITLLAGDRIYQMADFRQVDAVTRKPRLFITQKENIAIKADWTALICFAGVAHTGRVDVAHWLRQTIASIPFNQGFRTLVTALVGAESWLHEVRPLTIRQHTFTVGAFDRGRAIGLLVSNFQLVDGQRPRRFRLTPSHVDPQRPMILVSGTGGDHVDAGERDYLLDIVQRDTPPERVHQALAEINRTVASKDPTVSEACFTAHLDATGRGAGKPHYLDSVLGKRQDYM